MNDEKVQKLMKLVEARKSEIKNIETYSWKTNCMFVRGSEKFNIQVLDQTGIVELYSFLLQQRDYFNTACEELKLKLVFRWQNYSFEDWKNDLTNRLSKLQLNEKRKELETLQARLEKLISPELRASMELEEIEKSLGL